MLSFVPGLLARSWRILLGSSAVAVAHYYHAPWKPAEERQAPCPRDDSGQIPMQRYLTSM